MDQQNSLVTQFQHTTHIHIGGKEYEIEHLFVVENVCEDVFYVLSVEAFDSKVIVTFQRNVSLLVRLVSRSLNSIEQPLFFSSFLFLQPNPIQNEHTVLVP